MIAKHVAMGSVRKSSFSDLVKYITDPNDKAERVGHIAVTNCHSDRAEVAATEVLNTQAQNKRAISDRTYHLIVSFRPGESPDQATLTAVESRVCAGLGYGEHQRVSAVHHDTDNVHVHIAINTIHPTRYTMHNAHNDFKTLGELCTKLEQEYGLEEDNHVAKRRGAENLAADMESHSGVESLLGWVQRECADQLQAAQSWAELHQAMQENGLRLHERGNGLVVTAEDGTAIKASSIGRDYSKTKLEARLGAFERAAEQAAPPAKQYEPKPFKSRVDTVELYAHYKQEQQDLGTGRTAEWNRARERKNRAIEAAKSTGRLKRAAIKVIPGGWLAKKILYATTSATLKGEIDQINAQYLKERARIAETHQRGTWADWLQAQAMRGDLEALDALRGRPGATGLTRDTIGGDWPASRQATTPADAITKAGTIIYRAGKTAVRDDGARLNVSRGADQAGLAAALRMAAQRYGPAIAVTGSTDFKTRIVQAAVIAAVPIRFADPALELRRLTLLQETTHDSTNRGRASGSGVGRGGPTATRAPGRSGVHPAGRGAAARTSPAGKPNIAGVGRVPPPQATNRLRNLSELGVVQFADRGEVLLQGDVLDRVEHKGIVSDNSVRRDVSGTRPGLTPPPTAAEKYIAEREAKRAKGIVIPRHISYTSINEGLVVFAGLREIDGQSLALLKRNEDIMVLAIDSATARRLQRVKLGESITVTGGVIKPRGRSQ